MEACSTQDISLTNTASVYEIQYADDASAPSHDPNGLQRNLVVLHTAYRRLGLRVNERKTEVLQTSFRTNEMPIQLYIDDKPLKNTQSFCYLGSIISACGGIDEEINSHINHAAAAFGRLRSRVFTGAHLRINKSSSVPCSCDFHTLSQVHKTITGLPHSMYSKDSRHNMERQNSIY